MIYFKDFNHTPSSSAFITENHEIYKYSDVTDIANLLFEKIHHRTLIFHLSKNTVGSLLGYVSFLSNNVVPLMLDASLNKDLLDQLIEKYKPEYLWLPCDQRKDFPEAAEITQVYDYCLLQMQIGCTYPLHPELGLLLTTSGSTGSPKLVRLSYENILANATSIAEYLSIDQQERPITTLPMSYSFGLSIINSHFLKGATLLLTNRSLMEKEFWSFLKEQQATSLSGVPYTYEMLKKLRFFRMDLPSLKTMTQAGGKLNNELNKEFCEFARANGKRFFVMYGQTEATARMSYLPHEYALEKLGSMGIAIPGGEFSIIDDNGQIIREAEVMGELVYTGRNVSLGYAEKGEDLAREDENKGKLFTGDLAKRDKDNFYYIVGRKKRFIKIFGNRVNLDETERLLKNIIHDCACTGTDDHMLIYVTEESRIAEVKEYIASKTGLHPTAFSVRYIDSIPKNSSGKTIYANLAVS